MESTWTGPSTISSTMTLQETSSVFIRGADGGIERSVNANKNESINCQMSVTRMVNVSLENEVYIICRLQYFELHYA